KSRISRRSIGKLIEAIDLQNYLKQFLEIKRSGNNFVARCPFHQDSSPSLYIYPDHYHCFACKAHGNVIEFEIHRTGFSFKEAVESIAQKTGFPLEYEEGSQWKHLSAEEQERVNKQQLLQKVFDDLQNIFKQKNIFISLVQEKSSSKSEKNINEQTLLHLNEISGLGCGFLDIKLFSKEKRDWIFSAFKQFRYFNYSGKEVDNALTQALCFPVQKENGEVEALLFFPVSTVRKEGLNEPFIFDISCFDVKKVIILTSRSKFSYALFCHWNTARQWAIKEKKTFITQNPFVFFLLLKLNFANVIWNPAAKISLYSLNIISRRVKKLVILRDIKDDNLDFLWYSLENILAAEKLSIESNGLAFLDNDVQTFFQGIEDSYLSVELSKSAEVIDDLCFHIFHHYSEEQRRYQIESKILPSLYKMKDPLKKKSLLNEISQKWFGSTPHIFKNQLPSSLRVNPDISALSLQEESEEQKLKKLFSRVVTFYHKQLFTQKGEKARHYLLARGFSLEHIKRWKIGFCPEESLLSFKVKSSKIMIDELEKVGAIKPRRDGKTYYDFFYQRIVIPISDQTGEYVGIGGRICPSKDDESAKGPKYLNSPESTLFSKSHILFNMHQAMSSIVTCGYAIVVEGYMDCMTLVNAGVTNVVAVLGTSLGTAHVHALSKLTGRLCLCFDRDDAGKKAAQRSFLSTFPYFSLNVEYLFLPEGKDPDEYVSKFGKEAFLKLIDSGTSLLDVICRWIWEEVGGKEYVFLQSIKDEIIPTILSHKSHEIHIEALSFICEKYLVNLNPQELLSRLNLERKALPQAARDDLSLGTQKLSRKAVSRFVPWAAKTQNEIKILFALCFSVFTQLPKRLQNVLQGIVSENPSDEMICAKALSEQFSERGLNLMMEMSSHLLRNPLISLCSQSMSAEEVSNDLLILLSYVRSDVNCLVDFGLQELLKEPLSVRASMVMLEDMWNVRNCGFLRFQLKNVQLAAQRDTLHKLLADILLSIELEHLNKQLRLFSSHHFNVGVDAQFLELAKERSRRLKLFDSL
ncbi:MAG: toprim domain-containing protein, partial [Silvanigrellaceae bacterium]|nr:toprim domain-containing protein [Silvanigrellaceae bacterium]